MIKNDVCYSLTKQQYNFDSVAEQVGLSNTTSTFLTNNSSSFEPNEETFPLETVQKACQLWMTTFFENFNPLGVNTYTFGELYLKDVQESLEETQEMQAIYNTLWKENNWVGKFPKDWRKHSDSKRSFNIENRNNSAYIFKFSKSAPGGGVPGAHFLRVPKGKELKRIVEKDKFDELEIVDESLIALKSKDVIKNEKENEQCFYFVVKSKKINRLDETETINRLASYDQEKQIKIATQIMQLICKSGIGDMNFENININKDTDKLVFIDTEPLFGSLLLNEESKFHNQYQQNDGLKGNTSNARNVERGLDNIIKASGKLPVFKKVAEIYKDYFKANL